MDGSEQLVRAKGRGRANLHSAMEEARRDGPHVIRALSSQPPRFHFPPHSNQAVPLSVMSAGGMAMSLVCRTMLRLTQRSRPASGKQTQAGRHACNACQCARKRLASPSLFLLYIAAKLPQPSSGVPCSRTAEAK